MNSDHEHYQKNKSNPELSKINFSSIDKNEHAPYIFEFINFIRHRTENNSIKPFSYISEIKEYLKGQWSQLFQKLLSENNNTKANIRIVDGTEGYLTLLAEIIEKSEREVLFTLFW